MSPCAQSAVHPLVVHPSLHQRQSHAHLPAAKAALLRSSPRPPLECGRLGEVLYDSSDLLGEGMCSFLVVPLGRSSNCRVVHMCVYC